MFHNRRTLITYAGDEIFKFILFKIFFFYLNASLSLLDPILAQQYKFSRLLLFIKMHIIGSLCDHENPYYLVLRYGIPRFSGIPTKINLENLDSETAEAKLLTQSLRSIVSCTLVQKISDF